MSVEKAKEQKKHYDLTVWRFNVFKKHWGNAQTWPKENRSTIVVPSFREGEFCSFNGYSYLQTIASHFCKHRKHKAHVALTEDQLRELRNVPWMSAYLTHIEKHYKRYGARQAQPTTDQKIDMLLHFYSKTQPQKGDFKIVKDGEFLPPGVKSHKFDGRRFMDSVSANWLAAYNFKVKKRGLSLTSHQMTRLLRKNWFYNFIWKSLRRKGVLKPGDHITLVDTGDTEHWSSQAASHNTDEESCASSSEEEIEDSTGASTSSKRKREVFE